MIEIIADMPRRFLRGALEFYPKVLKVREGRLRGSFQAVSRKINEGQIEMGLKAETDYAEIQHEGGRTPAHVIEPRIKQALYWKGAEHPVKRVNHPGSNIRPKYYFKIPIEQVVQESMEELLRKLGLK